MFGISMDENYALEILTGVKNFDARPYPTKKRGEVAIIGSRSRKIMGTVTITGCHEITAREYVDWHCTGVYAGRLEFHGDMNKTYYAYDMAEPVLFILSHAIPYTGRKGTFVPLDEETEAHVLTRKQEKAEFEIRHRRQRYER